ncbi:MAG: hypothetical protein PPP56_02730 [Longimonas sp.]|uniref:hypothetical protein n=1 Tax=Longimonas sp. TaxID=2039626 RepID=UPI003358D962
MSDFASDRLIPLTSTSISSWLGIVLVATAVLLVGVTGCDTADSNDSDEEDLPPETLILNVDGEETELNAFFSADVDPQIEEEVFFIYFTEDDTVEFDEFQRTAGLFSRLGERPGIGTYAVTNIEEDAIFGTEDDFRETSQFGFAFWKNAIPLPPDSLLASNSGEVTLRTSDEDRVTGSFEIDATRTTFDEQGELDDQEDVSVEGAFHAVRIELPAVDQ